MPNLGVNIIDDRCFSLLIFDGIVKSLGVGTIKELYISDETGKRRDGDRTELNS